MSRIVTEDNYSEGLKVVRGPDWKYDNQDGGSLYGTICEESYDHGWVDVTWENGYTNAYRIGYEDRHDLYFYEEQKENEKLNKQLNEKENGESIKFEKSIPTIRKGKRLTGNGVRIKKRRIKVGSGHLSYTAVNTKF